MKRLLVIAETYAEGHGFVRDRRNVGGPSFVPSVVTPTTHPGAIAGIKFDEVVNLGVELSGPVAERVAAGTAHLKEKSR